MALTRNFKKTVVARVERDPAFAKALLDEAATLFLSDEPETARVILRDLVNATLGFEQLAKMTATPSKSLHRMLRPRTIHTDGVLLGYGSNSRVLIFNDFQWSSRDRASCSRHHFYKSATDSRLLRIAGRSNPRQTKNRVRQLGHRPS